MDDNSIADWRLISQGLINPKVKEAKDVINWMGAIQAQDFRMAKWAIGLRMKKVTESKIDEAINSRQILRTHVLRPTWHFISADDIYWMLQVSAGKIKSSMKERNKELELNDTIFNKCNATIEKSLKEGNDLTRKELVKELAKCGIATDNNRASHILLNAELEGIICSGKMKGAQITYALLNEVIPKKEEFNKEKALFDLSCKYFKSRCPATFQDFLWWSGLSVKDGKYALELIKNNFFTEKIKGKEYIFPDSFKSLKKSKESIFLLPAFDEFLISYTDRSASVFAYHQSKAFSNNGIFWPTIVENGKVTGTWKREIKKTKTVISLSFFDSEKSSKYSEIKQKAEEIGSFLKSEIEIITDEKSIKKTIMLKNTNEQNQTM